MIELLKCQLNGNATNFKVMSIMILYIVF